MAGRGGAPGFFGSLLRGMPTASPAQAAYMSGLTGRKGLGVAAGLAALQNIAQGYAAAGAGSPTISGQEAATGQGMPNVMFLNERRARRGRRFGAENFLGPLIPLNQAIAEQQANAAALNTVMGTEAAAAGQGAAAGAQPSGSTMGEMLLPGGTPSRDKTRCSSRNDDTYS